MVRIIRTIAGIVLLLLGILWTLQGSDLIWMIQPILCFADCEPLVGGSRTWLVAGLVAIAIGLWLLLSGRRSRA